MRLKDVFATHLTVLSLSVRRPVTDFLTRDLHVCIVLCPANCGFNVMGEQARVHVNYFLCLYIYDILFSFDQSVV